MFSYFIQEDLILKFTCGWLLLSCIAIWYCPKNFPDVARLFALFVAFQLLFIWIMVLKYFDFSEIEYQFEYTTNLELPNNIADLTVGLDGFSLLLILLTVAILPICIYASWSINKNINEFLISLLMLELFLILSFYTTNLLFFFIFFESVLIPMYVIIGFWGSRNRKIKAAYYFFFFTLFGSIFLLFGILQLVWIVGSLNYNILFEQEFSIQSHLVLFILFFIPFAIKTPMFPFHIWLPEAHVEAPTIGSVILASLLLKLGSFGFLKFTFPLFWYGAAYFSNIVEILTILSIIYASLATFRQTDMKKIIAYSSIAHMNLIVLGLVCFNQHGIHGSIYLMLGHGFVSSALFFCVGVLYDRYHTRSLKYYGGLMLVMPWFTLFFLINTLANMSFPGTSNFIGEFVILVGIFERNFILALCAGTGIVFSAIYSIWLFNRICFGSLKTKYIIQYCDVTINEFIILSLFTILVILTGIQSTFIFDLIWYL